MKSIINALEKEMTEQAKSFKGQCIPKISLENIETTLTLFKKALFPGVFHMIEEHDLKTFLETTLYQLKFNLEDTLQRFSNLKNTSEMITQDIIKALPKLKRQLKKDLNPHRL